jgi:hypothetical protein
MLQSPGVMSPKKEVVGYFISAASNFTLTLLFCYPSQLSLRIFNLANYNFNINKKANQNSKFRRL